MVSGINAGYYNPYQSNYMLDQTSMTPVSYNTPVFTGGVSQDVRFNAPPVEKKDSTADGKDDGSIGFFGAVKNMAKGVWNFVTSPFKNEKGEWSLKSTLKSLAIGAAFVVGNVVTGGALTPILLAAGAVAGVGGAVKAGYNIATAKTDAEAEAAWQSMGSSAATIAATAVGARGYAKAQAGAAAEKAALAEGKTAAEAAEAGATAAKNSYNGLKGAKDAVGRTFVDSYHTGKNAKTYLFGQKAREAVLNADGTVKTAARPEVQGKIQQTWGQLKDSYNNSSKETWYGKVGDIANQKYQSAVQSGKDVLMENSDTYLQHAIVSPGAKLSASDKLTILREAVTNYAKTEVAPAVGYTKGQGYANNAKAIASNPGNIGTYTWLTTQTVKPDFYDSLSSQEKAYFDALPKEQREQLEDYYYSMV